MHRYCNGHNHTRNCAMVRITLKVGYHFCQVILFFCLYGKNVVPFMKYRTNYEFFVGSSCDPQSSCDKNDKRQQGAHNSKVETHCTKPI